MPENTKKYPEFADGEMGKGKREIIDNIREIDIDILEIEKELESGRKELEEIAGRRPPGDCQDGGIAQYAERLEGHIRKVEGMLVQARIIREGFQGLLEKRIRLDEKERGLLESFESKNIH